MKTKILEYLEKNPESSAAQIASALGDESIAVVRVLNALRTECLIECEKGKGKTMIYWASGTTRPVIESPAPENRPGKSITPESSATRPVIVPPPVAAKPTAEMSITQAQINALKEANYRMEEQLRTAESQRDAWRDAIYDSIGADTPDGAAQRIKAMRSLIVDSPSGDLLSVDFTAQTMTFHTITDAPVRAGVYALVRMYPADEADEDLLNEKQAT